jgi:hypothetical protein
VHAAADRLDDQYDTIRAVRDHRFKYLRNLRPDKGYYLPIAYREQMPTMQELLRLRDEGRLNPVQMQWFRTSKPEEELFDTETDPHEVNDLAGDPAYADKLSELREEYERWSRDVPDFGRMPEREYVASIWPDGVQPETQAPRAAWNDARLTLTSQTEGASIGYQVVEDGRSPGPSWNVFAQPFSVEPGQGVWAMAHRIGYRPSGIVYLGRRAATEK